MYAGVAFAENFADTWREGAKDASGAYPFRMVDDQLEEKFWSEFIEKLPESYTPDAYVITLQAALLELFRPGDTVLEIGPGWGNHTFAVARRVQHLTCIDSSFNCLNYLRQKSAKERVANVEFLHSRWEEHSNTGRYDVVFGVNSHYRMLEIEKCILQMNQAADRLVLIGMTSGPEKPHLIDLMNEQKYELRLVKRDYIHLINILYQLGIDANCRIVNLEKTYVYDTEEELFRENTARMKYDDADKDHILNVIQKYCVYENGKITYPHKFKGALIYWEPVALAMQLR